MKLSLTEFDDFVFDGVRRAADGVSAAMTRRKEAVHAAGAAHADVNGAGAQE